MGQTVKTILIPLDDTASYGVQREVDMNIGTCSHLILPSLGRRVAVKE
jgi:hypothetical protein